MIDSSFPILPTNRPPAPTPRRGGFSFIEVMFAVLILGIGFILVAGIFPVAIGQTQSNGDETDAAGVARQAVNYLGAISGSSNPYVFIADGQVHRFDDTPFADTTGAAQASTGANDLWDLVKGNLIQSEDARFAWVPLYCRNVDMNTGLPADSAQVFVFVLRNRNRSAYVPQATGSRFLNDLAIAGSGASAASNLMAQSVSFTLTPGSGITPDQINLTGGATALVTTGAFLVVATDPVAASANGSTNSAVGWVLRIGGPVNNSTTVYTLAPGGDTHNSPGYRPSSGETLTAWVVGCGPNPDQPGTYGGLAQDIMVYSGFIALH